MYLKLINHKPFVRYILYNLAISNRVCQLVECQHIETIQITSSKVHECKDCIVLGDDWVHLRLCTECGYVGCCDSSKNKHATKHFRATTHPIIKSQEAGESWMWCYIDELLFE